MNGELHSAGGWRGPEGLLAALVKLDQRPESLPVLAMLVARLDVDARERRVIAERTHRAA